jgi:hypothetical protein
MTTPRYQPSQLHIEAASLVRLLGGVGSKHFIIVGGIVPPLLAPDAPTPHIGSRDIDFCLSVAFSRGETREYYKSVESMIGPYFRPTDGTRFRWIKRDDAPGLRIIVDFLAPADDADSRAVDGVRTLDDEVASDNAGPILRPLPLDSGDLIDKDAETTVFEGIPYIYDPGVRADITVRHAGPVGFLAAKGDALEKRHESKDGYDVSWWCLHAADTAKAVADLVISRPQFAHAFVPEAVSMLKRAFRAPDYPGPTGYATETYPDLDRDDEVWQLARNEAFARVAAVLDLLHANLKY